MRDYTTKNPNPDFSQGGIGKGFHYFLRERVQPRIERSEQRQ